MRFALKELPLDNVGLFGATTEERSSCVGEVATEVDILSGLVHPNIVRYYESFVEAGSLYIVMELVDGVSLMDHLTSLAEKGQRMPEDRIWQILVQVTLALSYIHTEKGIVHRDVTPSNILLDHGCRRAKLADFGLAKQKAAGGSIMQSAVGTITYCCPEIVQHSAYTDKADVWCARMRRKRGGEGCISLTEKLWWLRLRCPTPRTERQRSLGCVLYCMLMLRPPFEGSNPIMVASRIVEGKYESLGAGGGGYGERLCELVPWLLERDPERRPSITELSVRLTPHIMADLVQLSLSEDRLQAQLAHERERRASEMLLAMRNQSALQRLLQAQEPQILSMVPEVGAAEPASTPPRAGLAPRSGPGPASSPKLSIKQNLLRPISDPLAEVLGLLHKLLFVEKQAGRDPRRRLVQRFVRELLAAGRLPGQLKASLLRLQLGSPLPCLEGDDAVSYAELGEILEEILRATSYY